MGAEQSLKNVPVSVEEQVVTGAWAEGGENLKLTYDVEKMEKTELVQSKGSEYQKFLGTVDFYSFGVPRHGYMGCNRKHF